MTTETEDKILDQLGAVTAGAALGALTKHAATGMTGRPGAFAAQVGSVMGAAVAAVAPFAIVGGAAYGLYLLAKKLDA